ncbi:hypothetical protein MSG28_006978 [Choristoneura fumiferana]|uniref:Uncharacterized protein n=1 Tax=Choristoneura fumiferana TaxID=7141 RepID=A0ACC0JLV6_CHOFU|nr:hypothetical protein MSG28_006978 [Choristoneura fumiferana]
MELLAPSRCDNHSFIQASLSLHVVSRVWKDLAGGFRDLSRLLHSLFRSTWIGSRPFSETFVSSRARHFCLRMSGGAMLLRAGSQYVGVGKMQPEMILMMRTEGPTSFVNGHFGAPLIALFIFAFIITSVRCEIRKEQCSCQPLEYWFCHAVAFSGRSGQRMRKRRTCEDLTKIDTEIDTVSVSTLIGEKRYFENKLHAAGVSQAESARSCYSKMSLRAERYHFASGGRFQPKQLETYCLEESDPK